MLVLPRVQENRRPVTLTHGTKRLLKLRHTSQQCCSSCTNKGGIIHNTMLFRPRGNAVRLATHNPQAYGRA